MDSFLPAIHPTPSHLVTPLHLALTILPPSSTLPFASPFSLLAPMAFYAFSAPTSFVLAFCLPALKDSSLDLSPWYFARLITHARYQPVVPAEHKGTRNLNMPPGASETYIENHWKSLKHVETLNFWMPYLGILRAWLPAGVATFWSDCGGRCSVWTRSFQAVKSCVAKWKGSTWFNMVQRHFAPSSLPQLLSLSVTEAQCIRMCCCGKWSEWSKKTSQIINIFIIHPRVWQSSGFCFLPVLIAGRIAVSTALGDSRGGGTAPAGLPDLKRGSWMLRMAIWGSHHPGPCSWFQKKERRQPFNIFQLFVL